VGARLRAMPRVFQSRAPHVRIAPGEPVRNASAWPDHEKARLAPGFSYPRNRAYRRASLTVIFI